MTVPCLRPRCSAARKAALGQKPNLYVERAAVKQITQMQAVIQVHMQVMFAFASINLIGKFLYLLYVMELSFGQWICSYCFKKHSTLI